MRGALYAAALLTAAVALAHSYLGERYILIRLFKRDDLPRLFGDTTFTTRTLRFAWHLTSVAWWGFAALLVLVANPPVPTRAIGLVVGVTFVVHGAVALIASRGRHLAWVAFLIVGVVALLATR